MTPEQKAAYIIAQAATMLAEIEAMKVANAVREAQGFAFAYDEDAFRNLTNQYGLHNNALLIFFEN